MSRFVVAMGERFDVVSQNFLTPVVLKDPLNEWQTVGGKQLEFYLHGPATALFTYGLPVTQVSQHQPSPNTGVSFFERLCVGVTHLFASRVQISNVVVFHRQEGFREGRVGIRNSEVYVWACCNIVLPPNGDLIPRSDTKTDSHPVDYLQLATSPQLLYIYLTVWPSDLRLLVVGTLELYPSAIAGRWSAV